MEIIKCVPSLSILISLRLLRNYETQRKPFKWTRIADELFERGPARLLRLGKHCRERWNNHLNPALNKCLPPFFTPQLNC